MINKLSFKKRIELLEHLVSLLIDKGHLLQYRMAIAINYLYIGDYESAEKIASHAKDKFIESEDDSIYTKFMYAKCLSILADLRKSGSLKKESYFLLSKITANSDLTDEGRSRVLHEMADCLFHLSEFDAAIKTYEMAYKLSNNEINKVFIALCLADKSDNASLDLLNSINSESLDESEFFDYAVNYAYSATKFQNKMAIQKSLDLLKQVTAGEPIFEKKKLELICELTEILTTGQYSRKQYVLDILKGLSKYFILQPNIAGIGLDINRILTGEKVKK
jgi:tetratricopeptide (TPR) repeat protein